MSTTVETIHDVESTRDLRTAVRNLPVVRRDDSLALRLVALASVAVLLSSYLSVLYYVVETVGGVELFLPLIAGSAGLAVVLGSLLTRRQALWLSVALLLAGLAVYVATMPPGFFDVWSFERFLWDIVALLTGFSILRLANAGTWALAVLPGPTFLAVYFAVRNEYIRSVTIGGLTLAFFVLTGDSGTVGTLVGAVGAAGAVGFSTLARRNGTRAQVEVLAVGLAAMILATATVSAVPGGNQPVLPTGAEYSVQNELAGTSDRTQIHGSIRLSPKVRFTVEADRAAYWRVGVYDRFTGTEWIRTGETDPLEGQLGAPPGPTRVNEQVVSPAMSLDAMPAAAKPTRVTGVEARITDHGGLQPSMPLEENENYTVVSRELVTNTTLLQRAGTDYPGWIESTYTQVPSNLPDRVDELTANITANAETPYEAARAIELWLESNKNYSLNVDRPSGNIVDGFLFDREAGYCVYFATSMVTMLRTQGIPARYVVGYTSGQRVDEDTWVVRGLDAHAWVEVYFPDLGWVKFDPTPADPRSDVEQDRIEQAREDGVANVDAAGSENGTYVPTTETAGPPDQTGMTAAEAQQLYSGQATGSRSGRSNQSGFGPSITNMSEANITADTNVTVDDTGDRDRGGGLLDDGVSLPPPETMALWSVLAVGLAASVRRTGAGRRVYRAGWLRWQPAGDPLEEAEGAYARVEYVLARQHRPRRQDETVREYLDAVDADREAREVARRREQVRYAGRDEAAVAEEARSLAASYVRSQVGVATTFNRLLP